MGRRYTVRLSDCLRTKGVVRYVSYTTHVTGSLPLKKTRCVFVVTSLRRRGNWM